MAELRECPFCGGTDIRKLTTYIDCNILCRNCGASMMRTNFIQKGEMFVAAEPEAIKAWNRRADNG